MPAYVALLYLRRHEAHVLLTAVLGRLRAADVGAYFVGKQLDNQTGSACEPWKKLGGFISSGMVVALILGMICVLIGQPVGHFFSPIVWST